VSEAAAKRAYRQISPAFTHGSLFSHVPKTPVAQELGRGPAQRIW